MYQRHAALHTHFCRIWCSDLVRAVLVVLLIGMPIIPASTAAQDTQPLSSPEAEAAPAAVSRAYLPMAGRAPPAPTPLPSATPRPNPSAPPLPSAPVTPGPGDGTVRQALFYDRPVDGTALETVVSKAQLVVLGRGVDHWMKELNSAGHQGLILQYFLALEAGGPGPYKNSSAGCSSSWTPLKNTVGYRPGDFCKYIHPNESWFLHNSRGERLYSGGRSDGGWNYQMNPASAGWRAYARTFMARDLFGDSTQAKIGFEGIFLDNVPLKIGKVQKKVANATGSVKEFGDDAGYKNAVIGYLDYLNDGLRRDGRPLWGNLIEEGGVTPSDYLRFTGQLDGYMHEAWATGYIGSDSSAERWEENLSVAETTLGQGKGLMATAQGEKYDYARQRFALASYLLVSNGGNAYFRYADYHDTYRKWYQYDNYNVKLGAPKGKRYRSGSSWRRDFACGHVIVDPVARSGSIVSTCP